MLKAFKDLGKPLARRELLSALKVGNEEKGNLRQVLSELLSQGRIIKIKEAYGLTESMRLVAGRLQMQRSGAAFVIPDDKRRKDIFIRPHNLGEAWHGDHVVAAVLPTREQGRRPEGRIARVVERASTEMTALVKRRLGSSLYLCQPTDPRQPISLMADTKKLEAEPMPGDVLMLRPEDRLEVNLWAATATRNFGREEDIPVQEALVKANHSIPTSFPGAVLDEANELPTTPSEADWQDSPLRRDLRAMGFVTIDGAKARDFDDAVYVEERGRGYVLWVAIADVSHYVWPGSALDQEALERGNSYYFPQSVEPMFPERLSNGLCSLKPNEPRLAMVVEIELSAFGEPGRTDFYPAVIESKARLTYGQVHRALDLGDEQELATLKPVLPMLKRAEALARLLRGQRLERGSLDFDLPEPEILFNLQGETTDIRRKVRTFSNQLIEEFMIAANEAVARRLEELEMDVLYRVHPAPDPDKLAALMKLVTGGAVADELPDNPSTKDLQALLARTQGTDVDFLVNRMVLRSMMQAKYSPENEGHFGLASECYCHFTSPIRRYADLVVHRSLKAALGMDQGKGRKSGRKGLKTIADHLSARERVAMEAEREILKRITVLFLTDKVGGEFNGVISGVSDFGFWVELTEVMADGLVRLSTLSDDYYTLVPERQELLGARTGRIFKLGQQVRVELSEVNLGRLEITLSLLSSGPDRRSEADRKWDELVGIPPVPSDPVGPAGPAAGPAGPAGRGGKSRGRAAGRASRNAPPTRDGGTRDGGAKGGGAKGGNAKDGEAAKPQAKRRKKSGDGAAKSGKGATRRES